MEHTKELPQIFGTLQLETTITRKLLKVWSFLHIMLDQFLHSNLFNLLIHVDMFF